MAAVGDIGNRERRMSRMLSTQVSCPHYEEIQKCCCNLLNVKLGSFLFLLLDVTIVVLLLAALVIHIIIATDRVLIFIVLIALFCIGALLSVGFTWLAVRTEKADFLWVFIAFTIATMVIISGLGVLLVLDNIKVLHTGIFKASFFGFNDSKLSGSSLLTFAVASIVIVLVGLLIWKLTILVKFYYYLFENSADGRINHVRNDTRLHRRRKSTPYHDRRSSVLPESEENNMPNDTAA